LRHADRQEDVALAHPDLHGMITVLIAYDCSLIRLDTSRSLCTEPDLQVVGTVADDLEVIPAVHSLRPDVLVIESMRLGLGTIELTQRVTAGGLHTCVVSASVHVGQAFLIRALRSGVAGVVLKPFDRTEITYAVREAAAARHYLSPRLRHTLEGRAQRMRNAWMAYARLTIVERRILALVAAGHSVTGISVQLCLTRAAAEAHRRTLMQKLGLRTQADLAVYALRWRIAAVQQRSPAGACDLR
jgi:DNA-binding NarL/FixJ family response regulator